MTAIPALRGSARRTAVVPGAPPLLFENLAIGGRDPSRRSGGRFNLLVEEGAVVAAIGDEDSGVGELGSYALALKPLAAGRVEALGVPLATLKRKELLVFRRRIGFLPSGDGLLQNLTLRDNIALPLRYASDRRLRQVEEHLERLLEKFGLAPAAALRPAQANEEERRRAAFARAIALDPPLVVLEQPFDGLTARVAVDLMRTAIRSGGGEGRRTVFLTAQDLAPSVLPLMSRVVLVTDGQAVEQQSP